MTNGKQILIVEGDTTLVEMLSEQLQLHEEFGTVSAASGIEGLELSKKNYYDVIILDVGLPDMDGRAVCRLMRRLCSRRTRHWRRRQRPGRAAACRDGTAAGCRLERTDRRLELARRHLARARLEGRNPVRGLADRGRLAAARRARLPGAQKVMVDAMEIEERWM